MDQIKLDRLPDEVGKSIPEGERICWYGTPNWISFGYHAFGCKYLTLYFILSAFYSFYQVEFSFSFITFFGQYISFLVCGFFGGAILFFLAYLMGRHTCYVITEKRVIIRTGVALVFLLNMPFRNIISIDKQALSRGLGNLSFKSKSRKRIPYLSCWPSVRSGSLLAAVPTFRSISNIEEVGKLVEELAVKNCNGNQSESELEEPEVAA